MSEQGAEERRELNEVVFDELFGGVKEKLDRYRSYLKVIERPGKYAWVGALHHARSLVLDFKRARTTAVEKAKTMDIDDSSKLDMRIVEIEQDVNQVAEQLFHLSEKLKS